MTRGLYFICAMFVNKYSRNLAHVHGQNDPAKLSGYVGDILLQVNKKDLILRLISYYCGLMM